MTFRIVSYFGHIWSYFMIASLTIKSYATSLNKLHNFLIEADSYV